jgi:hypothetical protein
MNKALNYIKSNAALLAIVAVQAFFIYELRVEATDARWWVDTVLDENDMVTDDLKDIAFSIAELERTAEFINQEIVALNAAVALNKFNADLCRSEHL